MSANYEILKFIWFVVNVISHQLLLHGILLCYQSVINLFDPYPSGTLLIVFHWLHVSKLLWGRVKFISQYPI